VSRLGLEGIAAGAFNGTSFSPERRAEQYVAGYEAECEADIEKMRQHAVKGGTEALLDAEVARYVAGYRRRASAYLASHARIVSWMIAGPSNFPARRMEKRNRACDAHAQNMIEWRERAMKSAITTLRPDLRPIMSGDSDAVERLEAELATLNARQERMKQVNLAHGRFLKHGEGALESSSLDDAAKALIRSHVPRYSWEPHPFAPYELTNNGANIRRVEARIASLKAAKATPVVEIEANGIRLEDDPPANRVRLFFPGKPAEEIRAQLKSSGFRWAPSVGAWQAYRNHRAMETAKSFVKLRETP
jgi:hypothetical protein